MEPPTTQPSQPRKTRRTANACVACRQSKIKCSGNDPCQNCQRRAVRCNFTDAGGSKVVVSEKYLQDLQHQAEARRQSVPTSTGSIPSQAQPRGHQYRSPIQASSVTNQTSPSIARTVTSRDGPSIGHKRSADSAFGPSSDGYTACRPDPALVSPASLIEMPSHQQGAHLGPMSAVLQQPADSPFRVWSSAYTVPSKTIKNPHRNKRSTWLWLAPSSTWSFVIRLMLMLRDKLHPEDPSVPPSLVDMEVYNLTWKPSPPTDLPDISGLPSLGHAIYLFNTVKFHLTQTYRFFDEAEFERQINEFYSNALQKATESRLWFVKFLLIMAFGAAFHATPKDTSEPPGSRYFTRAMDLVPDTTSLWRDSILAIEVLALAALYLFSIDQRESGSLYLGQAIRIAQLEGMHTLLPEDELGVETVTTCRNLWWTLYILDRHFSASLGLPMLLQDSDITTPATAPNIGSQGDSARSLQVNLSHLMTVILTTVYTSNLTPLDEFLEQTRSVLHTLAHHAQEIEKIIRLKFHTSVGTMSLNTRFITLLYHKCVIIATRPLLLSVMKERLDILGNPNDENWESFLAQTGAVISTGIKSAAKTLQILTSEDSFLETFLPFDLEFAVESAIHLTMADALFPGVVNYQGCRQLTHQVLDELVARGNRIAGAKRSQLYHLETLCQELVARVQQQGHQTLHLFAVDGMGADLASTGDRAPDRLIPPECEQNGLEMNASEPWHHLQSMQPNIPSNADVLESIGISSEEFLHIVQQMGDPETLPENTLTLF